MSARQSALVSTAAVVLFEGSLEGLAVSVAELDGALTFDSAFSSRNTFDACVEDFAAGVAHPAKGMTKTSKNIAALVTSSVCIRGRVGQNRRSCQKNLQARKKTPVILGPLNTTDAAKAADEASRLTSPLPQKHLLLVSAEAFAGEDKLRQSLPQQWVVHAFKGALRAREALLIGVRPEVLVIDLATEHEAMLSLIERIKRSADPKINAMEVVAYQCAAGSIKDRAIGYGVSAFVDDSDALLPFLGINSVEAVNSEVVVLEQTVLKQTILEPITPELQIDEACRPEAKLNESKLNESKLNESKLNEASPLEPKLNESVLAWIENQTKQFNAPVDDATQERAMVGSGLLLHGKLFFHQIGPSKNEVKTDSPARTPPPPRPLRLALLKQQLRAGDDLMADDNGRFWLSLRTDNELKAIRVALRLAVALTRSSDPRHFVVGVALSGAYLGDDASTAMQICQDTLPDIEPSGQLAVAVDRWKFSMPLLVAQALV